MLCGDQSANPPGRTAGDAHSARAPTPRHLHSRPRRLGQQRVRSSPPPPGAIATAMSTGTIMTPLRLSAGLLVLGSIMLRSEPLPRPARQVLFSLRFTRHATEPGTISMRPQDWEGGSAAGLASLAVDNHGQVYLLDSEADILFVYGTTGKLVRRLIFPEACGEYVGQLAVDRASGVLFVRGSKVHVLTPSGELLASFGLRDVPEFRRVIEEREARNPERMEDPFLPQLQDIECTSWGTLLATVYQREPEAPTYDPKPRRSRFRYLEFGSDGRWRREMPSPITAAQDQFLKVAWDEQSRRGEITTVDGRGNVVGVLPLTIDAVDGTEGVAHGWNVSVRECRADSEGRVYLFAYRRLPTPLRLWGRPGWGLEAYCEDRVHVVDPRGRPIGMAQFTQSPFLSRSGYTFDDHGHVYATETTAEGIRVVRWAFPLMTNGGAGGMTPPQPRGPPGSTRRPSQIRAVPLGPALALLLAALVGACLVVARGRAARGPSGRGHLAWAKRAGTPGLPPPNPTIDRRFLGS